MNMSNNYLTQERYDELVKELETLKTEGRQEVARKLKFAKELGDLSENAEYKAVREEQAQLEARINELEELLRSASIIQKATANGVVRVGSKVQLKKNEKDKIEYTIVGSTEASPLEGLISNESPIGKALLGKQVGDVVKVSTPKGEVSYKVEKVE